MHTVTTFDIFKKEVVKMARQKNAILFHCYIQGDIFRIATAKRVEQFGFKDIKSEKQICRYIDTAIQILRKNLPEQLLIFSETNSKKILFRKIEIGFYY